MPMPESSSEIISSGVTPTCWRNRTNFSAARSKRNASFSSKSLDWLPFSDCGGCGVVTGNLRAA